MKADNEPQNASVLRQDDEAGKRLAYLEDIQPVAILSSDQASELDLLRRHRDLEREVARLSALPESEQLAAMAERNEALERDRETAWAAMEHAVNWTQRIEEEARDVRDRLLNAGEFSHFMRAEEPGGW